MPKYYIYQETTEWDGGQSGNHIYIFKTQPTGRSADAVAFIPQGQTQVQKFKKPYKLDLRGRTFEALA